jgi:hypothetical protein
VSYEQAIASFLRQADKSEPELDEEAESIDKLGTFIKRLSPELRSQFLRSSIDSGKGQAKVAKKLIARFPDDVILDALDDVNERGANLSQGVINFLQATARTSRGRSRRSGPTIIDTMAEEELGQKLRFMFREDVPERYIPPDYQKTLRAIAGVRALMVLDEQETIDLRQEIEGFPVEMQLCDIIMEIIDQDLEHGEGELLQHRLLEFCSLFLETGNFLALANIHRHLSRQCHGASFGFMPFHEAVLEFFVQPEVIAEVLNALTVWGKAKYEELQALVDGVGEPFVEPIFQRLAEETNMSLRRFYLDRLQSQGEATRAAAIAHLEDKRWFVVRNSIFLLRGMGNPAVLRHLRAVVDHPHPKVRHEVLKTLAHFRHPEAERLLVRELEGTNHEMRLLAIQAAEPSRDPRIVDALRAILNSKGVSEADIELKVAALRTLGKIGTRLVLPDIDRLLSAKAMLRSGGLQRLKAEVMKVLEEFPSTLARPALERVVKSGPTEFMPLARQILQRHDGVTP